MHVTSRHHLSSFLIKNKLKKAYIIETGVLDPLVLTNIHASLEISEILVYEDAVAPYEEEDVAYFSGMLFTPSEHCAETPEEALKIYFNHYLPGIKNNYKKLLKKIQHLKLCQSIFNCLPFLYTSRNINQEILNTSLKEKTYFDSFIKQSESTDAVYDYTLDIISDELTFPSVDVNQVFYTLRDGIFNTEASLLINDHTVQRISYFRDIKEDYAINVRYHCNGLDFTNLPHASEDRSGRLPYNVSNVRIYSSKNAVEDAAIKIANQMIMKPFFYEK
jgi:hypothetical protein